MKKLEISASFLCLCVVIILTSLAFFYQKGNTTDGTVGSDSPDKENTLKPSASKGSDEFVNDADASEHSQSSHAEIDYSTYESTTLGISISYPAALQDIMAIAKKKKVPTKFARPKKGIAKQAGEKMYRQPGWNWQLA